MKKKIAYKGVCDANSIRRAVKLFKCKPEQGEKNHFREVSVKAKFACDGVSSECAECRGEGRRNKLKLTEDGAVDRIKTRSVSA